MGKHAQAKWAARAKEQQDRTDAYITKLQSQLLPGQKLLTCPQCNRIIKVPEWQQMLCGIRYGLQKVCSSHPGEIKF